MTARQPGRLVLLGHPVAHSLSPVMQNAALERAGIALRYEALDVREFELPGMLTDLRRVGGAGNVTIPHKRDVAASCDRLTEVARRMSAVNTFWFEDGALVGDNTDPAGYRALVGSFGLREMPGIVAVIGAGGGAAAVCEAAAGWGAREVRLWNRHARRAHQLAVRYPDIARVVDRIEDAVHGASLVANATPIGLDGEGFPVPISALSDDTAVTDLVYRPGETAWVRAARAAGFRAADGIVMLVEQGAEAFARWFGTPPDRDAMWNALRRARDVGPERSPVPSIDA